MYIKSAVTQRLHGQLWGVRTPEETGAKAKENKYIYMYKLTVNTLFGFEIGLYPLSDCF